MMRVFERTLWAVFGLAAVLSACSPAPILDRLPSGMGLPAGTPARPETPYEYPAVHDMPPDRAAAPMTEEEQVRMEKDLANVRDNQEGREQPDKKTPKTAKKPAKGNETGQTAGAKANP